MNRGHKGRGVAKSVFLTLAILLMLPAWGMAAEVQVRTLLDTSSLNDPFTFDVDPSGAVLILTRDNMYDAGAREYLFGEPLKNPGWLAFSGGKLLFMANGGLFATDGRMPQKLLDIPLKGRIMTADNRRTFITGVTSAGKPQLFIYKEGIGHKALLELEAPIDAMTLASGVLFFSTGPRIYTLREDDQARLFAHLPDIPAISSLAIDEIQGVLYFSDGENLYAVRGNDFIVVRNGLGGMLRCRGNDLYLLSWRERALFQLSGLTQAFSSSGTLAPLKDPCQDPVLSLYCRVEEKRALIRALKQVEGVTPLDDIAARADLAGYMAEQKVQFERIFADLGKEAASGAVGIRWGGGLEPQALTPNAEVRTAGKGIGITLWNGGEFRLGPDSKAIVNRCKPGDKCQLTLDDGLIYFSAPSIDGDPHPVQRQFSIATKTMNFTFDAGRFALFASENQVAIVVIDGRVHGTTTKGESVTVAAGETLEAQHGKVPGAPEAAEIQRLNRWWESIR